MSWIRRRINRWRNYFSAGDYAGSRGGGSSQRSGSRAEAEAGVQHIRTRDSTGPTS